MKDICDDNMSERKPSPALAHGIYSFGSPFGQAVSLASQKVHWLMRPATAVTLVSERLHVAARCMLGLASSQLDMLCTKPPACIFFQSNPSKSIVSSRHDEEQN